MTARRTLAATRVRMGVVVLTVVGTVAAGPVGLVGTEAAHAVGSGVRQTRVVNDVPSTATPNVKDGIVYAITRVGNYTVLGGSFTGVQNRGSSDTLARSGIVAFNATSGTVAKPFAPTLDGTVQSLSPGPSANTVYVGGYFNNVNGVRSKGITLLSLSTGKIVPGFAPPALNGPVLSMASGGGHLFIAGGFTLVGALNRRGLASLNPNTGADDGYVTIALQGHHNYDGTGAQGSVGGRAIAINPSATRLVVIGNFTTAGGRRRDQIALIDLNSSAAAVDASWATQKFTAACSRKSFDTYVTDVQYAPDGSYFAVTATGGADTPNDDGSKALCDSVSRFDSADTGANVAPTWVDYTGTDTLWAVAISDTAVYVGGHQRWLNNPNGSDSAGPGAVPRPGLAALDPANGLPLSWDPGRNPRGAGAYALLVTTNGLYVGSDTDYFGDFTYNRQKIGFFALGGGKAAAPTTVATLPGKLFLGGPLGGQPSLTVDDLAYRPVNGSRIGATKQLANSIDWSSTRGAFVVGRTLFYGTAAGKFYEAPFNGTSVGTVTELDPYDDPKWASVQTGSGQTYRGAVSGYAGELTSVSGAFYSAGRLFYTLSGQPSLYWRWFSPDSGIVGADEHTFTGADFSDVHGITESGDLIYYATGDGTLHRISFAALRLRPNTDTVFSGPAKDGFNWSARSLLLYG